MFRFAINGSIKLNVIVSKCMRNYAAKDFLLADIGEGIAEVQISNWYAYELPFHKQAR